MVVEAIFKGPFLSSYDDQQADKQTGRRPEVVSQEVEWKRYESAAKAAHKVRMVHRLLSNEAPGEAWEDLSPLARRLFIEDARNVARNPSISADGLANLYRDHLEAEGELDHPELEDWSEQTKTTEAAVLAKLKEMLSDASSP